MCSKKQTDQTLLDEILSFRKHKYLWAVLLVLIGLSGIIIPIVPGFLFFLLALALVRHGMMAKLRRYFGIKK